MTKRIRPAGVFAQTKDGWQEYQEQWEEEDNGNGRKNKKRR